MSIKDLDLILKKDPIITTFPLSQLQTQPQMVEQLYLTHAKTHLSLGDTERHVDTIFKWVSGQNKGAFIGAVEGNYGEGKTSFLVHVWAKSQERRIFTVPPFEWISLADGLTAVGAWLAYILSREHPVQAKKAERLYQEYREKSLEDVARETAKQTGGDFETVLAALKNREAQGARLTEVTAEQFIEFCARASQLVREVGYQGLLVVLDEPEVAAKKTSKETVSHLLFDLANLLREKQGEYGVLVSMPTNFLADAARRYPALISRLQSRNCFPQLREVYGPNFATDLWQRYVAEFHLGEEGTRIVSPLALQAIGQVGSSERSDLAYGPRTVVSAFSRMVYHFRETGKTYEPANFVLDCLRDEIMVQPDFRTKVGNLLRSPEVTPDCRDAMILMAAFPNGMRLEIAEELGMGKLLRDLARRGTLVYKTAATYGLNGLRREGSIQVDPLRDAILEFESEFAPNRTTFRKAAAAFKDHVMPLVFEPRKGQQLVGWDVLSPWKEQKGGTWVGALVGAFLQTQKHYPRRAVLVIINPVGESLDSIDVPELPVGSGPQEYDVAFHFQFRWNTEQEIPLNRIKVEAGDPAQHTRGYVGITLDLLQSASTLPALEDLVETESMTAMWLLNLIHHMGQETLPTEFDAQWQAMRKTVLRDLVPLFFGEGLGAQAAEQVGQSLSGSGLSLMGSVFQKILAARFPHYLTLISSPHWQERVGSYVRALTSTDIPLSCRRGREKWKAEGNAAPKAFGTSRMNLLDAFQGMENLVAISTIGGRNAPLEVEFRIHPLEQAIADQICLDRLGPEKKLKIDGKECWWMWVTDLMPMIQTSGYTVEELGKIVEIGDARGTFSVKLHERERIVYCKPIDPDQMRRQLQEKLDDLRNEIAEFIRLPEFHTRLDVEEIARQIAGVQDESEYERIATRLNKEFEQLHQRLPGFFDLLQQELQITRSDVQRAAGQLAGSREVASLSTIPAGKSPWVATLSRHIVGNLKPTVEELRTAGTALIKELDGYQSRYKYQGQLFPVENIAPLVEGNAKAADAKVRVKGFIDGTRSVMTNLRDYEEWLSLLRRSDQVYEALLQLQARELDRVATAGLFAEYDKFSQEIADHLEVRNVLGLGAHGQFAATLDEIEKKRQAYLGQIKAEFDRRKDAVNRFLEELKLDRRVTTTFNPTASDACYQEMFGKGATHVREAAIARPLVEIEAQERELLYARDILTVVEQEQAMPLLTRLGQARASLTALDAQVTPSWLQVVTEEGATEERAGIVQTVDEALDAVRTARIMVRESTRSTAPAKGRAKAMYDLIAGSESMDLKEIVLRMMPGSESAAHVLDESLGSLVELFRSNCIQIRVERRRD